MQESSRENLSLAENRFCRNVWEVHPGADPVKKVAGYVLHSLRASSEDRTSLLEWNRG